MARRQRRHGGGQFVPQAFELFGQVAIVAGEADIVLDHAESFAGAIRGGVEDAQDGDGFVRRVIRANASPRRQRGKRYRRFPSLALSGWYASGGVGVSPASSLQHWRDASATRSAA